MGWHASLHKQGRRSTTHEVRQVVHPSILSLHSSACLSLSNRPIGCNNSSDNSHACKPRRHAPAHTAPARLRPAAVAGACWRRAVRAHTRTGEHTAKDTMDDSAVHTQAAKNTRAPPSHQFDVPPTQTTAPAARTTSFSTTTRQQQPGATCNKGHSLPGPDKALASRLQSDPQHPGAQSRQGNTHPAEPEGLILIQ